MNEAARDTPGLVLRPREGRPFRFDPGTLCLELLPTGGLGRYAVFEVLHEPADLVRWAQESRLPAGLALSVSAAELVRARELRGALWRLARNRAEGQESGPEDLDVVNAVAAAPPLVARIDADGHRAWAPGATGTALLSTVARDAVDLFTGPFAGRIRVCGAHDCALLFVDTSRPGRRRWCAMERCGNRHKVRAHRARHTETAEGDA
ncbi:zf-CGNR multi-domain protein [Streptomyces finlayi]|uniref:Zf-CGNR multi-domain protein n=1 Tax=Streptomyces finlayi TaxID=67296 RepID=A0A7G7BJW9_9ACTN|nr:ABATE domain-containing protein [Streptomyces finlayi]QNE75634.1 zf-CGNR multi-domain protein [Streptomyces finlayi]